MQEYKAISTGIGKMKGYSIKLKIEENAVQFHVNNHREGCIFTSEKVKIAVKELERDTKERQRSFPLR